MSKSESSTKDTFEKINKIIRSFDHDSKKSIDLLWEGFICSSLADSVNDRLETLELYKKLKLIISLADNLSE